MWELKASEIKRAEERILKQTQQETFSDEWNRLKSKHRPETFTANNFGQ